MKKLACFLMIIWSAFSSSSCNYKDLDKALFITAIVIDKGDEPEKYNVCFEAFRPSASSSQENQQVERMVYGVKNMTILEASDELNKLANLSVSFAQTKMLMFTPEAAEDGMDIVLDILHHGPDFTIRTYLAIWDGNPTEFSKTELKGEKFLGIYLRTHIENAERSTSHVRRISMLDLMNSAQVNGKIEFLPIIKPITASGTKLIDIPEVAMIRDFKMVGVMTSQESDVTNYMFGKVQNSFVEAKNPDAEGKKVLLLTVSCRTATDVVQKEDRMEVVKNLKVTMVMRGAEKTITKDKQTLEKIRKEVIDDGMKEIYGIYRKYTSQGIDVFNLGEAVYRKYPWFDQSDILNKVDLKVNLKVDITGTNYKLHFSLPEKHNRTNKK